LKDTQPEISVVVPLLNEEESLQELLQGIRSATQGRQVEVIFVDDGSMDHSWEQIKMLAQGDALVRGIRFRRNFGKSYALQAGFEAANGEYVITMDADLQDDPNEIPDLVHRLEVEKLDLISGWKQKRYDPVSKTLPSKFFNYVTAKVSGIPLHDFNCGLKAYRAEVIKTVKLHGELHRYIPLLAKWEGFNRISEQVVKHHPRKFGHTKFGLSRFVKGYLDLVTLVFIHRYMERPMHFFGSLGTLGFVTGFGLLGWLSFRKIFFNEFLSKRPLLWFAIMMILLGAQFFAVGLLGEMNKQAHRRDGFAIKETV
jgi:glycosyltransferase involved in cell wall biosynthesis